MIEALNFLMVAWQAYSQARKTGRNQYVAVTRHGVPKVTLFLGVGREAWRISQRAIEEFEGRVS